MNSLRNIVHGFFKKPILIFFLWVLCGLLLLLDIKFLPEPGIHSNTKQTLVKMENMFKEVKQLLNRDYSNRLFSRMITLDILNTEIANSMAKLSSNILNVFVLDSKIEQPLLEKKELGSLLSEIAIQAQKSRTSKFSVVPEGMYMVKPTYKESGEYAISFAFHLEPNFGKKAKCVIVYDQSNGNTIEYPTGCISQQDKKSLAISVGKNPSDASYKSVENSSGRFYFLRSNQYNMGVLLPTNGFLLLYRISFWLFFSFGGLFLYALIRNKRETREKRFRKEKMLDKVISAQTKTIEKLEENLETLARNLSLDPKKIEKIIEPDPTLYFMDEKLNESPADVYEISQDSKQSHTDSVIDLEPVDKQFIFLDPDSDYARKHKISTVEAHTEKGQQLRKKAFTPEVINLMKDVAKPDVSQKQLLQKVDEFQKKWGRPDIQPWTSYLNEVYFDEVTKEEIFNLLAKIVTMINADAGALLTYDPYLGCYRSFSTVGMPAASENKLFVLDDDPHLRFNREKIHEILVTSENLNDVYFTKRFISSFVKSLYAIYSFPLIKFGTDSFLVLFYKQKPVKNIQEVLRSSAFEQYPKELTPALKFFLFEKPERGSGDQTLEMLKSLREITGHARRKAHVIHIFSNTGISDRIVLAIEKRLRKILIDPEKFFYNTPNHLLLFLSMTKPEYRPEKVLTEIASFIPDLIADHLTFPEIGKNYYSYI